MRAKRRSSCFLLVLILVLTGVRGFGKNFDPEPAVPRTPGERFLSTKSRDSALGSLGATSGLDRAAFEAAASLELEPAAGRWGPGVGQKPGPLSLAQIQKLIVIAPDSTVAGEVHERGVSFKATSRIIDQLKNLGAGSETLKVLSSLIAPNNPPSLVLEVEKTNIQVGEVLPIKAEARDPDNDPLQYRWFTSVGSLEGEGPAVQLKTSEMRIDADPLAVLVGVEIDDGRGGTARQAVALSVTKPNRPPAVSLKVDKTDVEVGDVLSLTAKASDPDGDKLQYVWSTTAGSIEGSGPSVKLKTERVALDSNPLQVKVSLEVRDGRGGTKTETVALSLKRSPPIAIIPPQAVHKVRPVYPQFARTARLSGQVVVEVTIDESGNVVSAKVAEGLVALRQVAVDAVKKWKFRPAMRGDQPVSYTQRIAFDFKP